MSGLPRPALALLLAALVAAQAAADDKQFIEKGKRFLASLREDKVDAETVKSLGEKLAGLAQGKIDPNADFIGEGLIAAYPGYRKAMKAWFRDYYDKAATRLMKVSIGSDNDYLVAHTNYFLARAYLQQGLYERAEGILGELVASELKFFHRDYEVLFYHGLAQGQLLSRKKAAATFDRFVKDYPGAPERYRMLAKKIAAELKVRGENELYDLSDRMSLVQRWLAKQHSGKSTQKQEKEIVEILNRLIKMAEEKEKNCSGSGGGGGGGGGGPARGMSPSGPASSPSLPSGPVRPANLSKTARNVGKAWGMLGEKDRRQITQFLEKNFPERYQHLLKQYYKELSKGNN